MCGLVYYSGLGLSDKEFSRYLETIDHRGPDDTEIVRTSLGLLGFKRLAIMDLSYHGNQPFNHEGVHLICNGEIYNFDALKETYNTFNYQSHSDCEVLIPLFLDGGIVNLCHAVDAEFAVVIVDENKNKIFAARDPIGIRPLFYGYSKFDNKIAFASEAKALESFCHQIAPFPPGHYYADDAFHEYLDISKVEAYRADDLEEIFKNIRTRLSQGVIKRLHADAPVGFLLSGGLDSSLVCSIAQKESDRPIRTFAIGMSEDAIDLKYAQDVADFLKTEHTPVIIERSDALKCLRDVIYHLETWDITTVRASVGMYLICKYIGEETDIKVLLTGEVSDEIFGYKYTDFAPSAEEFQAEATKRVRELYMYDVLRADRCISAHSLEARVPFSDRSFVQYVMSIDPEKKMNVYNKGKYLLRMAFKDGDYLPESILMREKAAFSDAVGHSLVDCIKDYANKRYSDEDLERARSLYQHCAPFTKESLLYREIFEEFYSHKSQWVADYWMPNKEWENCNVDDPSARVLPNYGKSGE